MARRCLCSVFYGSERDLPRGATRSGLIDSTRCQSSEQKGNFFLVMCIAHTVDGQQILQHEPNYMQQQWSQWLELQGQRMKNEVRRSKRAILVVIKRIQGCFLGLTTVMDIIFQRCIMRLQRCQIIYVNSELAWTSTVVRERHRTNDL